jgi:hypothetical protein
MVQDRMVSLKHVKNVISFYLCTRFDEQLPANTFAKVWVEISGVRRFQTRYIAILRSLCRLQRILGGFQG